MKNSSWTFPSSFFDSLVVLKYMLINQFSILYEVNSDKQPCLGCPGIIFLTVVWLKTTPIRRLSKSNFSIFCCFLDSLFNRLKIKTSKYEDMATIQHLYSILEQYVDFHAIWHQMNRTNSILNRICHIVRHHKNLILDQVIPDHNSRTYKKWFYSCYGILHFEKCNFLDSLLLWSLQITV